jgi:ceramide glucosyltransferase
MMTALAGLAGLLAVIGVSQALFAARLVVRFSRIDSDLTGDRPPVTVLKPLHGNEPMLEEALYSLCRQAYAPFQIVFGVQNPADPAIAVVTRLQKRFPGTEMALVVNPTLHGRNRKVGNLINMLPSARYDVLVIADSDVHVREDYLECIVAALAAPGVGLVTTLYAGLPAFPVLTAQMGAMQITHGFLPSALLARHLGRRDCLGATMCLRRDDLARIGGLESLVDHLADDNVLGQRIRRFGLQVALARTVPLTTVPEKDLPALLRHELRWARTIRTLEPAGFAASILQYPLFWALLAVASGWFAPWSIMLFAVVWLLRVLEAHWVDRALRGSWRGDYKGILAFFCPVWLLPFRDVLSVFVMLVSYASRRVDWRGYTLHADSPAGSLESRAPPKGSAETPTEDNVTR